MDRLPELTTHSYSSVLGQCLSGHMTDSEEIAAKQFASKQIAVKAEATIILGALSKIPDYESTGLHIYTLSK